MLVDGTLSKFAYLHKVLDDKRPLPFAIYIIVGKCVTALLMLRSALDCVPDAIKCATRMTLCAVFLSKYKGNDTFMKFGYQCLK